MSTIAVNNITDEQGSGRPAFTNGVQTSNINGGQVGGRRNLIINGDMRVAQRGTSATDVVGGYNTVDRWKTTVQIGAFNQSQSSDSPVNQGFNTSLKMDCTTSESPPFTERVTISQFVESQDLQKISKGTGNAKPIVASFWVKSNKTGTYIVEIVDPSNSRQISKSYTINDSNVWEKKVIDFAGDTSGVLSNDSGRGLEVIFWLSAGGRFTDGTLSTDWSSFTLENRAAGQVNLADNINNEWYLTGVQLEVGDTATEFEHRSYGEELALCQRYYQIVDCPDTPGGIGINFNRVRDVQNLYSHTFELKTEMRASPSFSSTNVAVHVPGVTGDDTSATFPDEVESKPTAVCLSITPSSDEGGSHQIVVLNDGVLEFDAEL